MLTLKKLESVLEKVRVLEIESGAGDWYRQESSDVIEILCKDIKGLYKEYKIKNIQSEI